MKKVSCHPWKNSAESGATESSDFQYKKAVKYLLPFLSKMVFCCSKQGKILQDGFFFFYCNMEIMKNL